MLEFHRIPTEFPQNSHRTRHLRCWWNGLQHAGARGGFGLGSLLVPNAENASGSFFSIGETQKMLEDIINIIIYVF